MVIVNQNVWLTVRAQSTQTWVTNARCSLAMGKKLEGGSRQIKVPWEY